ncbi:MAG: hypothetical protein OEY97_05685 [Nitrospirota bacterium]|nr:hypothetical protein [Nitrospirota bacterium]
MGETGGTYLIRHWRGELPLWQSFWVNLVAPLVAWRTLVGWLLGSPERFSDLRLFSALGPALTLIGLLLCVWQGVGCWRAALRYRKLHRERPARAMWGELVRVQLAILVAVAMLWAPRFAIITGRSLHTALFPERGDWHVAREQPGVISVRGRFGYGLADAVRDALVKWPDTAILQLDSPGGLMWEAETLYRTLSRSHLMTYVEGRCDSACTYVFVAGRGRYVHEGAHMGFHGLGEAYAADPRTRRHHERLYDARGVDARFIRNALDTPPDHLLTLNARQLVRVGVAQKVVSEEELQPR